MGDLEILVTLTIIGSIFLALLITLSVPQKIPGEYPICKINKFWLFCFLFCNFLIFLPIVSMDKNNPRNIVSMFFLILSLISSIQGVSAYIPKWVIYLSRCLLVFLFIFVIVCITLFYDWIVELYKHG
jgi:hypothetical protein